MIAAQRWVRTRIACYGAAIAIILEQLSAFPQSTVTESPNPLVRVRDIQDLETGWHPDELITGIGGRQNVLVWESVEYTAGTAGSSVNRN
ncbi:MAG: hypothetical protein WD401_02080 [Thermomicrobiaceae bacterium]